MPGFEVVDMMRFRRDEWLAALAALVEHESPSRDKPALDGLASKLAARFEAIGGEVEMFANPDGGDHVLARFFDDGRSDRKPVLVLGHYDTVWPVGTLATMPFRVEEGKAFGPGVFDMKASLVEAEFAIDGLIRHRSQVPRPVVVLITSDEEIGSPTSRRLIEETASGCEYVLVLEPPLPGGSLKTARKGVGHFVVEVEGKAAHAGVEPRKGVSAILELAHQIIYLNALTDHDSGISVNVGVIEGGTTANVVAARASARVDVRATTLDQAAIIEEAIRQARPSLPGTHLTISGGFNRPPMERTESIGALFERARTIGRSMGLELGEGSTGGGSDGNFTAASGIPTLDGLGIAGSGAHASHEQIELDSLPERTALLASLLMHPETSPRSTCKGEFLRTMTEDGITIRRAETIADYLACQQAQRRAWGITDDSYVVPLATMVGAQLHGGLVLGAFTPSGEALGLSFAFLGKIEGRLCLYSQLTGVVPGQQGLGLGGRLKAAQREFARTEGLDCLAWAFDPLQAGNARFNLDRLGATSSRFVEDMYGRRSDALNANAATDRLIVEWSTDLERISARAVADPADLPRLIEVGDRPIAKVEGKLSGPAALLEIPADLASLRKTDPNLAEAWSMAVRQAFQAAFAAGYRADGFLDAALTCSIRACRVGLALPSSIPSR